MDKRLEGIKRGIKQGESYFYHPDVEFLLSIIRQQREALKEAAEALDCLGAHVPYENVMKALSLTTKAEGGEK